MSVSTCDQHVWLLVSQQFTQCRKGGRERGRCDRVPLFCMYKFHGVSFNYMHVCVSICSICTTPFALIVGLSWLQGQHTFNTPLTASGMRPLDLQCSI